MILGIALSILLAGPIRPVEAHDEMKPILAEALGAIPAPGGVMGLRLGTGKSWLGASGETDLARHVPADPMSRFRIWSISKPMTAALVLQLVDQGVISLDQRLSTWFPDFPLSSSISIEQLLSHTSGIPNYTDSPLVGRHLDRPWTQEQLLEVAAAMPRQHEPGARVLYSNSNYVLLGRILEKLLRRPLAELYRRRLFDPLGMRDTFVWGEESIPGGFARGYEIDAAGEFADVTALVHPSTAWACGAIVSTAGDLVKWAQAFFEGSLFSASLRERVLSRVRLNDGTLSNHGLGIEIDESPFGTHFNHGGGPLHGNTSTLSYYPTYRAIAVTLANGSSAHALQLLSSAATRGLRELAAQP